MNSEQSFHGTRRRGLERVARRIRHLCLLSSFGKEKKKQWLASWENSRETVLVWLYSYQARGRAFPLKQWNFCTRATTSLCSGCLGLSHADTHPVWAQELVTFTGPVPLLSSFLTSAGSNFTHRGLSFFAGTRKGL